MAEGASVGDRVGAVVVTYNSADVIEACVSSLANIATVVVVDNASTDDSLERVARLRPDAIRVANADNRGYGTANNQGYAIACTSPYVLIMNPDAALREGALEALVDAAERYPEASILAPRTVSSNGAFETTYDAGLFERAQMPAHANDVPEGDICTDFVAGAVLLLRTSSLTPDAPFDPNIFLFFDDDDLCLRVRASGGQIVFVAAAVAEHTPGRGSAPGPAVTWRRNWHMAWSRLYVEAKYRGRRAAVATGAVSLARFALKSIGYAITLNGTKARRDAARFAGTLAWLLGVRARPLT